MPDYINNIVHEGTGRDFVSALEDLLRKMPEDIAMPISLMIPRHIYRSPEWEWPDDRCIETDGHLPGRAEYRSRRFDYIRKKEIEQRIKNQQTNPTQA